MQNRRIHANLASIGKSGQRRLSRCCIGIAGLGGVGGIAFELLARAGIGRLKIADAGFFEESNANRQSLWTLEHDGKRKTDAAALFAKSIGAGCKIEIYGKITAKNSASFAEGCCAVIDATDLPKSRLAVFLGCRQENAPYIFASARGSAGMLTVFAQDGLQEIPPLFKLKGHSGCDHALGPVANAIGCFAAMQAMNAALGKPLVKFPSVLSIDAFSSKASTIYEF
jgi:adenylyltransferase/sulfurtransferase